MENVYGVSFPKCGRTWIRLMLAKIYAQLLQIPVQQVLEQEHCSRSEFVEKPLVTPCGIVLPHVLFRHGPSKGRISRGNYFPESAYRNKHVFLLCRDPRDVVVSFYYHKKYFKNKVLYKKAISEFIRNPYLEYSSDSEEARFGINPVINYMNAFVNNASLFKTFEVFYYEDFYSEPAIQLKELCEFIGLNISNIDIRQIVEFSDFDNMRNMEKNNTLKWHALPGSSHSKGFKTRKGGVGRYIDDLCKEDIQYINREIKKNINPFFNRYIT